ncbi:MAG: hypothetical protein GY713_15520 [Actinomycetia bacterium]|nr:hypothetical protein [Actinomycetes bacterium]
MRDRLDEIPGAEVVVVTFSRARNLRGYRRRFAEPLTVIADEERALYRALGFGRGSVVRVWGWRAAASYTRLMARGHRPDRPTEDTLQLGGNAVVDTHGRVSWVYAGAGPDDRPPVDEFIAAIRAGAK